MKAKILLLIIFCVAVAYFLSYVFSGRLILPQFFSLGPLTVHFYGITMALAVAGGFYFAVRRSEFFGISKKAAEDMLFWAVIFGFIGARLYHVLSSFGYYWIHPIDIFKVWNGGLSVFGAAIGGIATIFFIVFRKGNPLQQRVTLLLDWLTPAFAIGQILGRFGNFFNYEAFGYPTSLPWKMFVPENFRPEGFSQYQYFHPWFLYEQLGIILIFIALWPLYKSSPKDNRGRLFFSYLLLYNSLRFCLEFLRIDSTFIGIFRLNAAVSLLLAVAGLIGFFATIKQPDVQKT